MSNYTVTLTISERVYTRAREMAQLHRCDAAILVSNENRLGPIHSRSALCAFRMKSAQTVPRSYWLRILLKANVCSLHGFEFSTH